MIRHDAGGLTVEPGHGKGDAALTGPAASLLLVLMRRRPVSDPAVTVYGDNAVVDGWLASTAFYVAYQPGSAPAAIAARPAR